MSSLLFHITTLQMNHPFQTQRHELNTCKEQVQLCADILTLLHISPEDHLRMVSRREAEIEDVATFNTMSRCADRLGLLVETVQSPANSSITPALLTTWSQFLSNRKVNTTALHTAIIARQTELKKRLTALSEIEQTDDSSSYSDYSDTNTTTSDEASSSRKRHHRSSTTEEESEEESEEEEEESEEESEEKEEESEEEEEESEQEEKASPTAKSKSHGTPPKEKVQPLPPVNKRNKRRWRL